MLDEIVARNDIRLFLQEADVDPFMELSELREMNRELGAKIKLQKALKSKLEDLEEEMEDLRASIKEQQDSFLKLATKVDLEDIPEPSVDIY